MEALDIKATNDTPRVLFDPEMQLFEISGRSLPEDVVSFYQPILDWLEAYKEEPLDTTEFIFRLMYFNTATSKLILDILGKLEELHEAGHPVKVLWFYEVDDEDIQDIGEEFKDDVDIPFELVSY